MSDHQVFKEFHKAWDDGLKVLNRQRNEPTTLYSNFPVKEKTMKAYIRTEIIQAEPMDKIAFYHEQHRGDEIDQLSNPPGYKVLYPDGNASVSWFPKAVFEQNYREISIDEVSLEPEQIAKMAHEVNRAYCQAIGDDSQPKWDDAPEWQKTSAINGVKFHLEHPEAGPESSHNEWLKEKLETGWVCGPVKDPEKKEHPCCVPYEQLPTEQKVKDYLFRVVVDGLVHIS